MQIGGKTDELMYFRGCSLEFGRTYEAFVYIEASNGMVIDGGLMSGGVDIVVPWFEATKTPIIDGVVSMDGFGMRFTPQGSGQVWAAVGNFTSTGSAPSCDDIRANIVATPSWSQCFIDGDRTLSGVESVHRLSRCGLRSGFSHNVHICISAGDAEMVVSSLVVAVPETPTNIFRLDPFTAGVVHGMSSGPDDYSVSLGFETQVGGKAWATILPFGHSPPTVSNMKNSTYMFGASVCNTNSIALDGMSRRNASLVGCELLFGTRYHGFVYVEGEEGNIVDGGMMSGPVVVKAPWFVNAPRVDGAVSMDGFEVAMSTVLETNISVIVRSVANTSDLPLTCNDVHRHISHDENTGDAMNVGCFMKQQVAFKDVELNHRLTRCDLAAGETYRVHVCTSNVYGQSEVDSSLLVSVPITPTNIFYKTPAVASVVVANTTTSAVTLAFTAKEAGVAWGMILLSGETPLSIGHMKNATYGDGSVAVCNNSNTEMQIGGKTDELMYFRGCSLEFGRTYEAFVYIEASNGMVIDGGLMSGGVDIVVPWFEATKTPIIDGVVSMDGFGMRFTPQGSGQVWAAVGNFTSTGSAPSCDDIRANIVATPSWSQCFIDGDRTLSGVESVHRLSRCGLRSGFSHNVHICISAGDAEMVVSSLVVAVPETPTNIFRLDPFTAGVVHGMSSGPDDYSVSLGFETQVGGKAWATILPFGHSPPTVSNMKNSTYMFGASVCNTNSIALDGMSRTNASLVGCELLFGTRYHGFVYVEGEEGNIVDGGMMSGPVVVKAPWFVNAPRVDGAVSMDGFEVAMSTVLETNISVIVRSVANTSDLPLTCDDVHRHISHDENTGDAMNVGCFMKQQVAFKDVELNHRLTRCDLAAGETYRVHVCTSNVYGQSEVDSSLLVSVPITPTNIFYKTPAVASVVVANTSTSAVTLAFTAKEAGVAWGMILLSGETPLSIGHMKNATYGDGSVAVCNNSNTEMQIGGKTDELMYFRGCSLEFGRTYEAFVYIEASNGMVIDGGLMSGGVDIVVPWFEATKTPIIDGVVSMDGFGMRFTPQGTGTFGLLSAM